MSLLKLTQRSFNEQMFRHGFLSEQIPECFSSDSFADHTCEILELVRKGAATAPTSMSSYKKDASRRTISIPNPYSFASAVKLMGQHWEVLRKHADSENSLSSIVYCRRYNSGRAEALNNERARIHYKSKSGLIRNAKMCMAAALGFRYRLKLDIETCYDSMSPRTALWALCGKKESERYALTRYPRELRGMYDFAVQMARSVANQDCGNESGIITGPYTSRVFSEVVLARIDAELRERLGRRFLFSFRRYVDDYRFFFKTESEARYAIGVVDEVLGGYGMRLNQSKTVLDVYPFDSILPIKRRLESAYEEDGMSGLLNEAGMVYNEGEKGAFKYAMKMALSRTVVPREAELVLSYLFNITLVSPECSRYVVEVIEANRKRFKTERLSHVVAEQLVDDLRRGLDQEALCAIFFARKLELELPARAILEVVRSGCDLSVIIALDLWRKHRDLVRGTTYETRLVNAAIRDLEGDLATRSMDDCRWLLMYEAHRHKLLRSVDISKGDTAPFFAALDEMDVDFYVA